MNENVQVPQQPASDQQEERHMDPQMLQLAIERLRSEQNLLGGVIAGFVAAVIGSGVWAFVTVLTGYQIGWMAVGVGFLVGIAVRFTGKGIERSFGVAGALLALFGCLLGNLLTICYFISTSEKIGMFEVMARLNPQLTFHLMKATFSPMDLLFYAIAVYEGYKLSSRRISEQELFAATQTGAFQSEVV